MEQKELEPFETSLPPWPIFDEGDPDDEDDEYKVESDVEAEDSDTEDADEQEALPQEEATLDLPELADDVLDSLEEKVLSDSECVDSDDEDEDEDACNAGADSQQQPQQLAAGINPESGATSQQRPPRPGSSRKTKPQAAGGSTPQERRGGAGRTDRSATAGGAPGDGSGGQQPPREQHQQQRRAEPRLGTVPEEPEEDQPQQQQQQQVVPGTLHAAWDGGDAVGGVEQAEATPRAPQQHVMRAGLDSAVAATPQGHITPALGSHPPASQADWAPQPQQPQAQVGRMHAPPEQQVAAGDAGQQQQPGNAGNAAGQQGQALMTEGHPCGQLFSQASLLQSGAGGSAGFSLADAAQQYQQQHQQMQHQQGLPGAHSARTAAAAAAVVANTPAEPIACPPSGSICRRTRAHVSLRDVNMEELEQQLPDHIDMEEIELAEDDEQYGKFLQSLFDETSPLPEDSSDEDPDFAADLDLDFEENSNAGTFSGGGEDDWLRMLNSSGREGGRGGRHRGGAESPARRTRARSRRNHGGRSSRSNSSGSAPPSGPVGMTLEQISVLHAQVHCHSQMLVQMYALVAKDGDPEAQQLAAKTEALAHQLTAAREAQGAARKGLGLPAFTPEELCRPAPPLLLPTQFAPGTATAAATTSSDVVDGGADGAATAATAAAATHPGGIPAATAPELARSQHAWSDGQQHEQHPPARQPLAAAAAPVSAANTAIAQPGTYGAYGAYGTYGSGEGSYTNQEDMGSNAAAGAGGDWDSDFAAGAVAAGIPAFKAVAAARSTALGAAIRSFRPAWWPGLSGEVWSVLDVVPLRMFGEVQEALGTLPIMPHSALQEQRELIAVTKEKRKNRRRRGCDPLVSTIEWIKPALQCMQGHLAVALTYAPSPPVPPSYWTNSEDELLMYGLSKYGSNWRRISNTLLLARSSTQIANRHKNINARGRVVDQFLALANQAPGGMPGTAATHPGSLEAAAQLRVEGARPIVPLARSGSGTSGAAAAAAGTAGAMHGAVGGMTGAVGGRSKSKGSGAGQTGRPKDPATGAGAEATAAAVIAGGAGAMQPAATAAAFTQAQTQFPAAMVPSVTAAAPTAPAVPNLPAPMHPELVALVNAARNLGLPPAVAAAQILQAQQHLRLTQPPRVPTAPQIPLPVAMQLVAQLQKPGGAMAARILAAQLQDAATAPAAVTAIQLASQQLLQHHQQQPQQPPNILAALAAAAASSGGLASSAGIGGVGSGMAATLSRDTVPTEAPSGVGGVGAGGVALPPALAAAQQQQPPAAQPLQQQQQQASLLSVAAQLLQAGAKPVMVTPSLMHLHVPQQLAMSVPQVIPLAGPLAGVTLPLSAATAAAAAAAAQLQRQPPLGVAIAPPDVAAAAAAAALQRHTWPPLGPAGDPTAAAAINPSAALPTTHEVIGAGACGLAHAAAVPMPQDVAMHGMPSGISGPELDSLGGPAWQEEDMDSRMPWSPPRSPSPPLPSPPPAGVPAAPEPAGVGEDAYATGATTPFRAPQGVNGGESAVAGPDTAAIAVGEEHHHQQQRHLPPLPPRPPHGPQAPGSIRDPHRRSSGPSPEAPRQLPPQHHGMGPGPSADPSCSPSANRDAATHTLLLPPALPSFSETFTLGGLSDILGAGLKSGAVTPATCLSPQGGGMSVFSHGNTMSLLLGGSLCLSSLFQAGDGDTPTKTTADGTTADDAPDVAVAAAAEDGRGRHEQAAHAGAAAERDGLLGTRATADVCQLPNPRLEAAAAAAAGPTHQQHPLRSPAARQLFSPTSPVAVACAAARQRHFLGGDAPPSHRSLALLRCAGDVTPSSDPKAKRRSRIGAAALGDAARRELQLADVEPSPFEGTAQNDVRNREGGAGGFGRRRRCAGGMNAEGDEQRRTLFGDDGADIGGGGGRRTPEVAATARHAGAEDEGEVDAAEDGLARARKRLKLEGDAQERNHHAAAATEGPEQVTLLPALQSQAQLPGRAPAQAALDARAVGAEASAAGERTVAAADAVPNQQQQQLHSRAHSPAADGAPFVVATTYDGSGEGDGKSSQKRQELPPTQQQPLQQPNGACADKRRTAVAATAAAAAPDVGTKRARPAAAAAPVTAAAAAPSRLGRGTASGSHAAPVTAALMPTDAAAGIEIGAASVKVSGQKRSRAGSGNKQACDKAAAGAAGPQTAAQPAVVPTNAAAGGDEVDTAPTLPDNHSALAGVSATTTTAAAKQLKQSGTAAAAAAPVKALAAAAAASRPPKAPGRRAAAATTLCTPARPAAAAAAAGPAGHDSDSDTLVLPAPTPGLPPRPRQPPQQPLPAAPTGGSYHADGAAEEPVALSRVPSSAAMCVDSPGGLSLHSILCGTDTLGAALDVVSLLPSISTRSMAAFASGTTSPPPPPPGAAAAAAAPPPPHANGAAVPGSATATAAPISFFGGIGGGAGFMSPPQSQLLQVTPFAPCGSTLGTLDMFPMFSNTTDLWQALQVDSACGTAAAEGGGGGGGSGAAARGSRAAGTRVAVGTTAGDDGTEEGNAAAAAAAGGAVAAAAGGMPVDPWSRFMAFCSPTSNACGATAAAAPAPHRERAKSAFQIYACSNSGGTGAPAATGAPASDQQRHAGGTGDDDAKAQAAIPRMTAASGEGAAPAAGGRASPAGDGIPAAALQPLDDAVPVPASKPATRPAEAGSAKTQSAPMEAAKEAGVAQADHGLRAVAGNLSHDNSTPRADQAQIQPHADSLSGPKHVSAAQQPAVASEAGLPVPQPHKLGAAGGASASGNAPVIPGIILPPLTLPPMFSRHATAAAPLSATAAQLPGGEGSEPASETVCLFGRTVSKPLPFASPTMPSARALPRRFDVMVAPQVVAAAAAAPLPRPAEQQEGQDGPDTASAAAPSITAALAPVGNTAALEGCDAPEHIRPSSRSQLHLDEAPRQQQGGIGPPLLTSAPDAAGDDATGAGNGLGAGGGGGAVFADTPRWQAPPLAPAAGAPTPACPLTAVAGIFPVRLQQTPATDMHGSVAVAAPLSLTPLPPETAAAGRLFALGGRGTVGRVGAWDARRLDAVAPSTSDWACHEPGQRGDGGGGGATGPPKRRYCGGGMNVADTPGNISCYSHVARPTRLAAADHLATPSAPVLQQRLSAGAPDGEEEAREEEGMEALEEDKTGADDGAADMDIAEEEQEEAAAANQGEPDGDGGPCVAPRAGAAARPLPCANGAAGCGNGGAAAAAAAGVAAGAGAAAIQGGPGSEDNADAVWTKEQDQLIMREIFRLGQGPATWQAIWKQLGGDWSVEEVEQRGGQLMARMMSMM